MHAHTLYSDKKKKTQVLGIIFVRELAARLPDPTPVVACTVNPGYCRSNLFRAVENEWYIGWIFPLIRNVFFARSTEEGSKTLVHAAVAGEERLMHGRYLSSCQIAEESDFVFTPEGKAFSSKLWVSVNQKKRLFSCFWISHRWNCPGRDGRGLVSSRRSRLGDCCKASAGRCMMHDVFLFSLFCMYTVLRGVLARRGHSDRQMSVDHFSSL